MGTSRAISGGIVPRDVNFTGNLKLSGHQNLALSYYLKRPKVQFLKKGCFGKNTEENVFTLAIQNFRFFGTLVTNDYRVDDVSRYAHPRMILYIIQSLREMCLLNF